MAECDGAGVELVNGVLAIEFGGRWNDGGRIKLFMGVIYLFFKGGGPPWRYHGFYLREGG